MNPLERLILFSLAITRTIGSRQLSATEQASRIQTLNARRVALLQQTNLTDTTKSHADGARIALLQFLGRLANTKLRREI